MYAVLKQDIVADKTFEVTACRGHVYKLKDLLGLLASHDISDAGIDMIVCKTLEDAQVAYRVMHMERDNLWDGDDWFPWEPVIARALPVMEALSES